MQVLGGKKMQESTKNPSFIPATHFYNDFKRIYNA